MKKLLLLSLILTLLAGWSLQAVADELKNAQQQKNYVDSKLNRLLKDKNTLTQEKKSLENQKKSVEAKQAEEKKEYEELLKELELLNEEIKKITAAFEEAEQNYNTQREIVKNRLRVMYETSPTSVFETLLSSKSITEFFERMELMTVLAQNDKQMIEMLEASKKDIEIKRQMKEEMLDELEKAVAEKQERLNMLKTSRAQLDAQIREKQTNLSKLEKQIDDLNKESEWWTKQIKELSNKKKFVGGDWVWPLSTSKKVVSAFGNRRHPILKKYKMHTGIDIDGNTGDSILAANKGTVIIAQWQSGYGNTIVIDHGGGITTLYAHCSKLLAKVGSEVKAGQVIAKVGSTGLSTGPHLHFEVRKNGNPQNPLNYISP